MKRAFAARPWLIGALLAIWSGAALGGPTIAERAFEQLRQSPPADPDHFDFVVVGDTRSTQPIVLPEVFKQSIREWNALGPAFVIDIGDLILGGAANLVGPQWDEFERVIAECRVPLFPVTGNHDVSDAATEQIWLERVGPLCYAFSYGNSRFIALNSEEVGAVDQLSDAQVAWLDQDLRETDAQHIFLFLHKPYFVTDWEKSWAQVADVLRGRPVRVVFAGDRHLYRHCGERDGVRYVITAGGGAELRVPEDEGGFWHYCLVRVRGKDVSWVVIRPGNILPENCVTQARVDEVWNARTTWVGTEPLELLVGEGLDQEVTVFIENPYETAFESSIVWSVPPGWRVEPLETAYVAKAGEVAFLPFHVQADGPESVRFPVPEFQTVFHATKHGGPIPVRRRLDLVPCYTVPRAPGPVVVDGSLGEWAGAARLPLSYAWDFDIADTEDLEATCLLQWDEKNLYLAAEVYDDEFYQPYAGDIVWSADNLQLFIGATWEWGLSLTPSGPEVFLYKGSGREAESVNATVRLAIQREGRRTVYEAAFPQSELEPIDLRAGNAFRFSIVANDLDPSHPQRPRHWVELTPGVGDAIPGSPMAQLRLTD